MITLEHKVFELMTEKGEEAQVSDINNLKILINGYDNDLYVVKRNEEATELIKEPGISGNMMEGFSILEKFSVKDGALVHKKVFVTFYDEEAKQEILIKDMKAMHEINMWNEKSFLHNLEDEQAEEIIRNLQALALQNEESETKEQVVTEETTEKVEIPVTEVKTEEPKAEVTEQPKEEAKEEVKEQRKEEPKPEEPKVDMSSEAPTKEETVAEEKPKVEEPVAEITPVTEQTDKQIDENEIPELVNAQYKEYSQPFLSRGFEEYQYKNYRFITNFFGIEAEDVYAKLDKHASYAILLTPVGVAIMQGLVYFEPVKATDKIIKYRFYLDKKDKETRKYLYLDTENKTISIKKPKKAEVKADEKKEEKPVETTK